MRIKRYILAPLFPIAEDGIPDAMITIVWEKEETHNGYPHNFSYPDLLNFLRARRYEFRPPQEPTLLIVATAGDYAFGILGKIVDDMILMTASYYTRDIWGVESVEISYPLKLE